MIDLKLVHSVMNQKGFYYFNGITNSNDDNLYIDFSTGVNHHGDVYEFRFGSVNNDIESWVGEAHVKKINISDNELIKLIMLSTNEKKHI